MGMTLPSTCTTPPVLPGSEEIFLDGVLTTAYSDDYHSGRITFSTAPTEDVAITADYHRMGTWDTAGSDFAVYSFDQYGNSGCCHGPVQRALGRIRDGEATG